MKTYFNVAFLSYPSVSFSFSQKFYVLFLILLLFFFYPDWFLMAAYFHGTPKRTVNNPYVRFNLPTFTWFYFIFSFPFIFRFAFWLPWLSPAYVQRRTFLLFFPSNNLYHLLSSQLVNCAQWCCQLRTGREKIFWDTIINRPNHMLLQYHSNEYELNIYAYGKGSTTHA